MPAKGEVRVRLTADDAMEAAQWSATAAAWYAGRPDTLMTPGHNQRVALVLAELSTALRKAALRKRLDGAFIVLLRRELVAAAVAVADNQHSAPVPSRLVSVMRAALSGAGRPKLAKQDLEERVSSSFSLDDRHRARLVKRARVDVAWTSWSAESTARGETVLTSSAPLPKI